MTGLLGDVMVEKSVPQSQSTAPMNATTTSNDNSNSNATNSHADPCATTLPSLQQQLQASDLNSIKPFTSAQNKNATEVTVDVRETEKKGGRFDNLLSAVRQAENFLPMAAVLQPHQQHSSSSSAAAAALQQLHSSGPPSPPQGAFNHPAANSTGEYMYGPSKNHPSHYPHPSQQQTRQNFTNFPNMQPQMDSLSLLLETAINSPPLPVKLQPPQKTASNKRSRKTTDNSRYRGPLLNDSQNAYAQAPPTPAKSPSSALENKQCSSISDLRQLMSEANLAKAPVDAFFDGIPVRLHPSVPEGADSRPRLEVFQCCAKDCMKPFTRLYNLKSHMKTHNGERPFQCTQCNMSFRRSHDLKRHERVHTGLKPFSCPLCDKHFTRLDALTRHMEGSCKRGRPPRNNNDNSNSTQQVEQPPASGTDNVFVDLNLKPKDVPSPPTTSPSVVPPSAPPSAEQQPLVIVTEDKSS